MTFEDFMNALAYGRRIRRESWPEGVFMESNGTDVWLRMETEREKKTLSHFAPGDRIFTFADIYADDWIFYF